MSNSSSEDLYNRLSYSDRYDELYKHSNTSKRSKKKDIYLSKTTRWVIFFMFFITGTVANIDHGTIPGAIQEIKLDLNINKKELGLFGSLVFLGNLIGAMLSFTIINLINRKILLIASLGLCAICLYSFILTDIYWFLLLNRVLVGIFQVKYFIIKSYITIYMPVWCDQFGPGNKKTIMISIIQTSSPLGVVIGYYMTAFFIDSYGVY